jgi:hypothetical protein
MSMRRGVNQGMTTRRRSWWSPSSEPSSVRGPSTTSPSGPARRIISKTPGRNAGSSNSALQPAYGHAETVGVRTIHDSSHPSQCVRIGANASVV